MTTFYKRITGSKIQGNASSLTEQAGTLVINADNTVHIHDGTTVGGNPIGGGGAANKLTSSTYAVVLDSSGVLNLSTASTILGQGTDPNVYIETVSGGTTSVWTFSTSGQLTLPGATPIINGSGTGTNVTIIAQSTATTSTWVFGADGSLVLPGPAVGTTSYSRIKTDGAFLNLDVQYGSLDNVYGGARVGTNSTDPFDIITDFNGAHNTWRFGADGSVSLPNQSTLSDGNGNLSITSPNTASITVSTTVASWANFLSDQSNNQPFVVQDCQFDSLGNVYATLIDANTGTNTSTFTTGVVKYNNVGESIWFQQISGPLSLITYGLAVDQNNDVYINLLDGSTANTVTNIVKLSGSTGGLIWAKQLSDVNDCGYNALIGPDNNLVVSGTWNNSGSVNNFAAKINSTNGDVIWQKVFLDPSNNDYDTGMAIDNLGNITISGTSFPSGFGSAITLDTNGNPVSGVVFASTGTQSIEITDAIHDSQGNLYVTGAAYNNSNVMAGMLAKIDPAGNQLWAYQIGQGAGCIDLGLSLTVDPSDNVYVVGITGTSSFITSLGSFSSSGTELWQYWFNTPGNGGTVPGTFLTGEFFSGGGGEFGSNISYHNGMLALGVIASGGSSDYAYVLKVPSDGSPVNFGGDMLPIYSTASNWTATSITLQTSPVPGYVLTATITTGTLTIVSTSTLSDTVWQSPPYTYDYTSTNIISQQSSWSFDTTGALNLPISNTGVGDGWGVIQTLNAYPELLAYGVDHGGPELDWMNTSTLADFGSSTVMRNVMYINGGGLYVEMNANNVSGHPQPHWSFNPDGTTQFPHFTISTATGTTGTVLTLDGSGVASWQTPIGGTNSNLLSSFGTDQGVGSTYSTGNPVLFTNDDMLIRTGGTAAAGSGGSGQMYIMSAEDITIGTATDPASLTDATSGVTCDAKVYILPAHSNGGVSSTVSITAGSNTLSVDSVGGLTYNSSPIAGGSATTSTLYDATNTYNVYLDTSGNLNLSLTGIIQGSNADTDVYIQGGSNTWQFNAGGNIVFPDMSAQGTAWLGAGSYDISNFNNNGTFTLPYSQLSGAPTNVSAFSNDAGYLTSAFSGNYSDLSGAPTNVSAFTNDAGYLTSAFSGNYSDLSGLPTLFSGNYSDLSGAPTSLNAFSNDPGFITTWSLVQDSNPTMSGTLNLNGNKLQSAVTGQYAASTNHPVTLEAQYSYNATSWEMTGTGHGYSNGTNIATTGGSGTGMTVNIYVSGPGQVNSIQVNQPGTGYQNGDVIGITGGDGTAVFVIHNYNSLNNGATADWTFGIDNLLNGVLTLPGGSTITAQDNGLQTVIANGVSNINVDGDGGRIVLTPNTSSNLSYIFASELTIPGSIIPNVDAQYDLGSTSTRFRSAYVGTGSLFIQDITLRTNAELTVDNGLLSINGISSFKAGSLLIANNTLTTFDTTLDINLGDPGGGDTGGINVYRNIHSVFNNLYETGGQITADTSVQVGRLLISNQPGDANAPGITTTDTSVDFSLGVLNDTGNLVINRNVIRNGNHGATDTVTNYSPDVPVGVNTPYQIYGGTDNSILAVELTVILQYGTTSDTDTELTKLLATMNAGGTANLVVLGQSLTTTAFAPATYTAGVAGGVLTVSVQTAAGSSTAFYRYHATEFGGYFGA